MLINWVTDKIINRIVAFQARNRDETVQMIDAVVRWNANNHNRRITISLELEKPRRENLILALHVDVIFVGKDFGRPFGWTKESTVREIAKCAKNTWVSIESPSFYWPVNVILTFVQQR